jgi:hypothetical protein
VVALLTYLSIAGITFGPIFPAMSITVNAKPEIGVYAQPDTHRSHLNKLFTYVGGAMADCTSHSIRKAGCCWAARCGLNDSHILMVGRWKLCSACFLIYLRNGVAIARKYIMVLKSKDPVFSFWTFNSVVVSNEV